MLGRESNSTTSSLTSLGTWERMRLYTHAAWRMRRPGADLSIATMHIPGAHQARVCCPATLAYGQRALALCRRPAGLT
jgi:hypothetical protein